MATCKECLHADICKKFAFFLKPLGKDYNQEAEGVENICGDFKDCSRFIEQSFGFWIPANLRPKSVAYLCSICGGKAYDRPYGSSKIATKKPCGLNFCPNCGAKMTITKTNLTVPVRGIANIPKVRLN